MYIQQWQKNNENRYLQTNQIIAMINMFMITLHNEEVDYDVNLMRQSHKILQNLLVVQWY